MENPYSYKKCRWRITARPRISTQATARGHESRQPLRVRSVRGDRALAPAEAAQLRDCVRANGRRVQWLSLDDAAAADGPGQLFGFEAAVRPAHRLPPARPARPPLRERRGGERRGEGRGGEERGHREREYERGRQRERGESKESRERERE
jgi:hypothetical protein